MKKVLMTAAVMIAAMFVTKAQDRLVNAQSINFYGVDYSEVKVIGAKESAEEFKTAFAEINKLFLSEPDKYIDNIATRLKKTVGKTDITAVLEVIEDMDTDDLIQFSTEVKDMTDHDIEMQLKSLDIKPVEGIGLVALATVLDKGAQKGSYHFVFFDNKTMEVLDVMSYTGDAGGISLRNYWAKTFYRASFELNPSKFYTRTKKVKGSIKGAVDNVKEKISK